MADIRVHVHRGKTKDSYNTNIAKGLPRRIAAIASIAERAEVLAKRVKIYQAKAENLAKHAERDSNAKRFERGGDLANELNEISGIISQAEQELGRLR